MSERSSSTSNHPFAHLIGAKVTIKPELAAELSWDQGIIICMFATDRGVAAHVSNPETGEITPALTLDGLHLHEEALELLQSLNQMSIVTAKAMSQKLSQYGDSLFG